MVSDLPGCSEVTFGCWTVASPKTHTYWRSGHENKTKLKHHVAIHISRTTVDVLRNNGTVRGYVFVGRGGETAGLRRICRQWCRRRTTSGVASGVGTAVVQTVVRATVSVEDFHRVRRSTSDGW